MSQGGHSSIELGIEYTHDQEDYPQVSFPYDEAGYDDDAGDEEITQEDCWTVISSFFAEKGLVRQQLDSFDEFVQNTMQELVDENSHLILDQGDQHTGHDMDMTVSFNVNTISGLVSSMSEIHVAALRNRVWADISVTSYSDGGRWECSTSLSTGSPPAKSDLLCAFIHRDEKTCPCRSGRPE